MDYEGETKGELIDSYRSEHPDTNLPKLRVGYHKVHKRWVVIHHKGLSCFALSSSTPETACEEAVKKLDNGEIARDGFGQVTVKSHSCVAFRKQTGPYAFFLARAHMTRVGRNR